MCETCRYFIADPINPPAGLGFCADHPGSHYPMAPHNCRKHTPEADE